MENQSYLTISFERLSEYSIRISILDIHKELTSFINMRKKFYIKGIEYKANDNQLIFSSTNDKLIGKIEGLSGISPIKQTIIRTNNKSLIPKLERNIFIALQELVYVIKMCKHGPGSHNYTSYVSGNVNSQVTKNLMEEDVNRTIILSR